MLEKVQPYKIVILTKKQATIALNLACSFIVKNENLSLTYKAYNTLINSQKWSLSVNDYLQNDWKNIFKLMKSSHVKQLICLNNNNCLMLKQISHIEFTFLKHLTLENQRLKNLESIQVIHMPQLIKLNLDRNNLCNVKSLRKIRLKHIKLVKIANNRSNNFNCLDQFHSHKLNSLSFEVTLISLDLENIRINDLKFLAKMESNEFDFVETQISFVSQPLPEKLQNTRRLNYFIFLNLKKTRCLPKEQRHMK